MPKLDKAGVAAELGRLFNPGGKAFSVRTVTRWMRLGMPHYKTGRAVGFDEQAAARWARERFTRGIQSFQ